jgi:hypothetical protein
MLEASLAIELLAPQRVVGIDGACADQRRCWRCLTGYRANAAAVGGRLLDLAWTDFPAGIIAE